MTPNHTVKSTVVPSVTVVAEVPKLSICPVAACRPVQGFTRALREPPGQRLSTGSTLRSAA
jgi:hypothetical protein